VANVKLQRQLDLVTTREYRTSGKLLIEQEERRLLEEDLASALDVIEDNKLVIASLEGELEEFKAAAVPVVEYVAPAPAEGEVVAPDPRPLLERLRAAPSVRTLGSSESRLVGFLLFFSLQVIQQVLDLQLRAERRGKGPSPVELEVPAISRSSVKIRAGAATVGAVEWQWRCSDVLACRRGAVIGAGGASRR